MIFSFPSNDHSNHVWGYILSFHFYKTTPAKPDFVWIREFRTVPLLYSPFFFFVALQKKQLLCPAAEFVLRDYTVRLSGTWQGFVVSHTFLDNMADLLIWHGVHPCHLITGRTLILKRQHPKYEEDRCLQRETIHTVWIPRQMVHAWKMSNTRQYILQYVQA